MTLATPVPPAAVITPSPTPATGLPALPGLGGMTGMAGMTGPAP